MNTRQKEFFVERPLHFVLDVAVPWFIMVITYTPKKGLGTSKSEDTSVQIVTVHLKKTVVSGRVLSLFFLIRLTISSDYSDLTMFHMKEFLPLWSLYTQDQKALFSEAVLKFKQFLQLDNKRHFTLNSDVNLSEIQVHIDLKDITLPHRTYEPQS